MIEGRVRLPKRMNFRKSSKLLLTPPPSFSENYIAFFLKVLIKVAFKFQNLQYIFSDWKWPDLHFGTYPKIHPFWYPGLSLICYYSNLTEIVWFCFQTLQKSRITHAIFLNVNLCFRACVTGSDTLNIGIESFLCLQPSWGLFHLYKGLIAIYCLIIFDSSVHSSYLFAMGEKLNIDKVTS